VTDDIVTRLEREIELSDTCICNWMLEDSVDEIKRLRLTVEELIDLLSASFRYVDRTSSLWLEIDHWLESHRRGNADA
jgi:hypothetical protein